MQLLVSVLHIFISFRQPFAEVLVSRSRLGLRVISPTPARCPVSWSICIPSNALGGTQSVAILYPRRGPWERHCLLPFALFPPSNAQGVDTTLEFKDRAMLKVPCCPSNVLGSDMGNSEQSSRNAAKAKHCGPPVLLPSNALGDLWVKGDVVPSKAQGTCQGNAP